MIRALARIAYSIIFNNPFHSWKQNRKNTRALLQWEQNGKPAPPPHKIKQQVLKAYAKQYSLRVLVETGTFRGDMVSAMIDQFDRIISIELSEYLYKKARLKFFGFNHIELICGDSALEIKNIIDKIDEPALFWLDGHYSGGKTARGTLDTPIYEELNHILRSRETKHVVLIDDAREFETNPSYPALDEVIQHVKALNHNMHISVDDDIIRIVPDMPARSI